MSKKNRNRNSVQLLGATNSSLGMNLSELYDTKNWKPASGEPLYWQSAGYNTRLYRMFRAEIIGMCLNRFKWINLPKTCNERYLELTLLVQGQASIAFPKKLRGTFYSTQMMQRGPLNVYDNPIKWTAIGNNGFRFDADWTQGAVCFDNRFRYPLLEKIDIWAHELEDLVRTKQLNRQHQKIPFIFKVPQEMRQQAENLYKQVAGGEMAIIGTNGLEAMQPEVWNTGVEYIGEELNAEMENVWNEIYQAIGISNQTFKSERVIEDEVKTQREPSQTSRLDFINCRRECAEWLNTHFEEYLKKPIEVVWNYDNKTDNYNYTHDLRGIIEGVDNNDNNATSF